MKAISAESEAIRRREAVGPLLARHLDLVYAAALRQTRDPHMAEDVTQNVFLIAEKKAGQVPECRAAAWLVKVTRYVALNAMRSGRRRRHHEGAAAMETSRTTNSESEGSQAALEGHLDGALAALGEADRQLIVLRYLQNCSVGEVAAAFRMGENTASQRIGRALDKLRRYLGRRKLDVPVAALGTMLVLAVRPAPRALAGRIVQAVGAGSVPVASGFSLGVFLMTLTMKAALVAAAVVILLLTTLAGVYVGRLVKPEAVAVAPGEVGMTETLTVATRGTGMTGMEGLPVLKLEVVGNVRIETRAILDVVGVREGQAYSRAQVDQDLKAIGSMDLFRTLKLMVTPMEGDRGGVALRGVNVRFVVEERPL